MVAQFLRKEGYEVTEAESADEMRRNLESRPFELVILDLMLPDDDGLEIARDLRVHSDMAIIILTGKDSVIDRVVGLEVGADDYIVKPFDNREFLARVRSVLRRTASIDGARKGTKRARFQHWQIDFVRNELIDSDGSRAEITGNEFRLLALLVNRSPRTVTRQEISQTILGREWSPTDRSSDVLVAKLRKKIDGECGERSSPIKTVRGVGYKFATEIVFEQ